MDFAVSDRVAAYQQRLREFMDDVIYPAEATHRAQRADASNRFETPPVMETLKEVARRRNLWNLFLTDDGRGASLTNLEYAPLAEILGRSPLIAPEATNCAAPDTGNMELLARFGTRAQQDEWLRPLLDGEIRSCFSMTEPDVASSDANNIATRIRRDGDEYVISGRKWWSSGAMSPRCRIAIVMGVTDPDGDRHNRHSMVLVPLATAGVNIVRSTRVLGFDEGDRGGHAEIVYDDVRVPVDNLLGEEHGGFAMAQARLGPGRIHHCMRLIGMAERAFDLMCERAHARYTFGRPLAEHGVVADGVAEARIRIEQARLLVLKAAWLIDTAGARGAAAEISAIKAAVPAMAEWVIDRAIQVHGGKGLSEDTPLAELYSQARLLRIADGPDEIHRMALSRRELRRYAPSAA